MGKNYSVADMIVILLNKIHRKNSSLRLALSLQRKKYIPNDKDFWNQVYGSVLEIEKNYISINTIEKFVLPNRNISGIKSYLDLVTYWKFWRKLSSERLRSESKKFFFTNNKHKRLFQSFIESIETLTFQTISSSFSDPAKVWSFNFSLPALIYTLLKSVYSSKELNLLGNWFNTPDPTYIWINNQDDDFEPIMEGIKAVTSLIPVSSVNKAFIVGKGKPIQKLSYFKDGKILIQNLGATIVSQLIPPVSGTIIDLCASPGNKTIQLFDKYQSNDSCKIIAGDVPGNRFKTLSERVPKLLRAKHLFKPILATDGIQLTKNSKILELRPWNGTNLPFENEFADLIFIDAPCTGTGTMGTNPDVRQKFNQEFLSKHINLQRELLYEANRILKREGFIFYTTCSLLLEENENQITNFLLINQNYSIIGLKHPLNSTNLVLPGSIRLFPPQSKTEGFFAILLQKE